MVRYHFEVVAGGSDALALEVSRKPRAPEERSFPSAGGRTPADTFLSENTSNEDLNKELEEKEFRQNLKNPLEKLPEDRDYKIDNCRLDRQRTTSDPRTSPKNGKMRRMESGEIESQMTPNSDMWGKKRSLKKVEVGCDSDCAKPGGDLTAPESQED